MPVTFSTDANADITLFGDAALALLKMMGHSATVPGAILAADVPAALSRLKAAIDAEKASPPVEGKEVDEPVVSMAHRALPLINLLTAAAKAESNVHVEMKISSLAGKLIQRLVTNGFWRGVAMTPVLIM